MDVVSTIATEQSINAKQVAAVLTLLNDGGTVPFIARYRKERTGGLDEVQIRAVTERFDYLTELQQRREAILKSIEEQEQLTPELAAKINAATTKTELEDLYLPYKKKKKTRGVKARERGLEPLAERMRAQEEKSGDLRAIAATYANPEKDIPDADAALQGARDIIAEDMAEQAELRAMVRKFTWDTGTLTVTATKDKKDTKSKFQDYYDHSEPVKSIPSHRYLAIRRGEKEKFLRVGVTVDTEKIVGQLQSQFVKAEPSIWADEMRQAVTDAYTRLLAPSIATDVRDEIKRNSDEVAIDVFAENLRHLLLAAPLGGKRVLALDPGFRTGCKAVAVDSTGKLLEYETIFPHPPQKKEEEAAKTVLALIAKHEIEAIAIGNGTAGRETDRFVGKAIKDLGDKKPLKVMVNESGASVYSASAVARDELPELDVSVRGAVSIGRRLQDPLAELVKIDPRSIGVGQYQHDVNQARLKKKLDDVVESSVNHVGVDVNRASRSLLSHVAGIGRALAKNIVAHRDEHGAFASREQLQKVSMFGPKAFEQSAGFLRIPGSDNPLDNSAVHPERYDLCGRIAEELGVKLDQLVGDKDLAGKIELEKYVDDEVGLPTLQDIVEELKKPGRDPRAEFTGPVFRDDINEISDLKEGEILEGVVTNVTHFGAFVDIGVHQDGLVHVSELSHKFVSDPTEVVKVGDRLKVKVLGVEADRNRISLSAKQAQPAPNAGKRKRKGKGKSKGGRKGPRRADGKGGKKGGKRSDRKPRKPRGPDTSLGALLGDALKGVLDEK